MPPIYAEDQPYWKTSNTAADSWLEKAKKEIAGVKGEILGEAFVSSDGRSAYMLAFRIDGSHFKINWPVLQSRSKDVMAAKRQSATALYHDVKSRVVAAKFLGTRTAFASWLLLPGGQTVAEASDQMLAQQIPVMLMGSGTASGKVTISEVE